MRVRADPDPKHRLHLKLCTNASMAPDNQKLIPEKLKTETEKPLQTDSFRANLL